MLDPNINYLFIFFIFIHISYSSQGRIQDFLRGGPFASVASVFDGGSGGLAPQKKLNI